MIDHVLGRPSSQFRKIQVFAVVSFWSLYLLKGNNHGPPVIRTISTKLSKRLTAWQTIVVTLLWLYISRNFAKIVGLECPEPLANLYSRSYFRATWITTALDAGFWTAMKIRHKWLRDIASIIFSLYYLIAAERADEKVRRVRATLTVEHLRVSWNKPVTPYLAAVTRLMRPRFTRYQPRQIRIPRPRESSYKQPVDAWLYFDGPLSALRVQSQVLLDIPGGGFVAMSPRTADDRLLAWAGKTGVPILSLDYKKAPEYPYPYALNECYDVYRTITESRGRCLGLSGQVNPCVIVSGDSAGGNLAAGLTTMVLQSGSSQNRKWRGEVALPPPAGLILVYPALDMNIGGWMTEEQLALIQDKSSRKRNERIIKRKSEDYARLTPSASRSGVKDKSPVTDYLSHKENRGEPSSSSITAEDFNSADLAAQAAALADNQPRQIRTRLATSSVISYFGDRVLTPEMMRAMIILYIGPHNRPDFSTDYLLSPVLAPEATLARFPKTYILTGERDPLVDDTVIFAGRLRQAKFHQFRERQDLGLEKSRMEFNEKDHVEVALIPGISHGFMNFPGIFPEGWKHIHRCAVWINELFREAEAEELRQSSASLTRSLARSSGYSGSSHVFVTGNDLDTDTTNSVRLSRRPSLTESSADEDRPLEMRVEKFTPMNASVSDSLSTSKDKTRLNGQDNIDHNTQAQDDSTDNDSNYNNKKEQDETDTVSTKEATSLPKGPRPTAPRLATSRLLSSRNIQLPIQPVDPESLGLPPRSNHHNEKQNDTTTNGDSTGHTTHNRLRRPSILDQNKPQSFPMTQSKTLPKSKSSRSKSSRLRSGSTVNGTGSYDDNDLGDDGQGPLSTSMLSPDRAKLSKDKSFTRLPSEEDLLRRRMNTLAGGLMGLGEGVRTP